MKDDEPADYSSDYYEPGEGGKLSEAEKEVHRAERAAINKANATRPWWQKTKKRPDVTDYSRYAAGMAFVPGHGLIWDYDPAMRYFPEAQETPEQRSACVLDEGRRLMSELSGRHGIRGMAGVMVHYGISDGELNAALSNGTQGRYRDWRDVPKEERVRLVVLIDRLRRRREVLN